MRKTLVALSVVLLAFSVEACGGDPALDYLRSQPEYSLVYPDATLVSTTTQAAAA